MIVSGLSIDGARVSIAEVMSGRTKLSCACGSGLIAKKGKVYADHFAHEAGGQGACGEALRLALVDMAADAIGRAGEVKVPGRIDFEFTPVASFRICDSKGVAALEIESRGRLFVLVLHLGGISAADLLTIVAAPTAVLEIDLRALRTAVQN